MRDNSLVESLEGEDGQDDDMIAQWQKRRIDKMSQFISQLDQKKEQETLLEEELYNQIDQQPKEQKTITFAKNTKAQNTLDSLSSDLCSENITPNIDGANRKTTAFCGLIEN